MTLLADAPPVSGRVAPRHLTRPRWSGSSGQDAVDLAASAGLYLDPWQVDALDVILAERGDGRWAANQAALVLPRQNGKGSVLEALELFWLILSKESLILHSAHEFKTAGDGFKRLWKLIDGTPDLSRRVKHVYHSHGSEGIEMEDGARIRFVARTRGSGRGFPASKLVLDECFNLPDKAVESLLPTLLAQDNPQAVYASSAPLPIPESDALRRLCRRGREGANRLAFIEYCADHDADLDDRTAWADANPGIAAGRVPEESIAALRESMSDEGFAREILGIYSEADEGDWPIPSALWHACCDTDSALGAPLAWAVDASPNGQSAAVAVSDGRHIEVIQHGPGTAWVPSVLTKLRETWRLGAVFIDPKPPAGVLVPGIEAAGISIQSVKTEEHAQACTDLYQAVTNGTVRHRGQLPLNAALAGAATRVSGDGWVWSRRSSSVDISPLVAVTLARWAAEHGGSSSYESRGMVTL